MVRIAVRAAGVNFPDLLMVSGMYQEQPELPFAPGMEVAGEVTEVGDDLDSLSIGDRVTAYLPHGGYAEQAVTTHEKVFPIPDDMPWDQAAAFPIVYGTSYHALTDRASLTVGETLLVLGAAGGVGLAAVQIGVALGARVIGAVSSEEKERAVREAGAIEVIRYDREDLRTWMREMVPGGVDVIYDPVGGDITETAFRSIGWGGRYLVVGFAAGSIPSMPLNLPLLKGASLVGVFWGRWAAMNPDADHANFTALVRMWGEGRIRPMVTATYPLEEAASALRSLGSRSAVGKMVITP